MDFVNAYLIDPWRLAPDIAFWTVVLGTLVATACGWVGLFLMLRGQALVGDAISHTALLGIVVAYLVTGQLQGWGVLIGAAVTGILTVLLVEGLPRWGEVREDAAIGIVFTTLFALGVVLLGAMGDSVHLDTAHVLFGDIALALTDTVAWRGHDIPVVVLELAAATFVLAAVLWLGWKELVVTTFDPEFAATRGLPVRRVRYGLVAMLSLLVTGAFTSVGAILVVAFLIAPGATALLLSSRLPVVMALVPVVGLLSSLGGMQVAMGANVSTGGMMACTACGLFGLALGFAPGDGIVSSRWRRLRQRWRTGEENAVRFIHRREAERGQGGTERLPAWPEIAAGLGWSGVWPVLVRRSLVQSGWVEEFPRGAGTVRLTAAGRSAAERIERAHRLWETFLVERVGLPADHVHPSAEALEHTLDDPLVERVNDELGHPERDPHGSVIPRPSRAGTTHELAVLRVGDRGWILSPLPDIQAERAAREILARHGLVPGQGVRVVERDEARQTWTVASDEGRTTTLSHAEADRLHVRPDLS